MIPRLILHRSLANENRVNELKLKKLSSSAIALFHFSNTISNCKGKKTTFIDPDFSFLSRIISLSFSNSRFGSFDWFHFFFRKKRTTAIVANGDSLLCWKLEILFICFQHTKK